MELDNYKKTLYDIVHNNLYVSSILSEDDNKSLENIYNYFIDNDNAINDLRTLLTLRDNDTKEIYDKYIRNILVNIKTDIKLDILMSQDNYSDIIKNNNIFIDIYMSLNIDDKIHYLISKRKLTDIDILMINEALKENNNFNDNKLLIEIINNDKLINKIPYNSIQLSYNYSLLLNINLNNINLCRIFTKETYVKLLLKKVENFNDFLDLYKNNKDIFDLITHNSLLFDVNDTDQIIEFIRKNPNFIGKFYDKYLDHLELDELINFYNLKSLDNDSHSSLFNKLFKLDCNTVIKDFSEDVLNNCSKHSINVYLFDNIDNNLRDNIFNNYSLFNRFLDTIMVEAIIKHCNEEKIVDYLRNDTFVEDMSSYAIELLLNKLSFRSSFNMLQRKNILDKVNSLNIEVDNKDIVFIKGFLDSPSLVLKSDHSTIYNMLNLLSKDEIIYYIVLPYITNSLSNSDIINLFLNKEIDIDILVNNEELIKKLNKADIVSYIDSYFEKKLDLNIFKNIKLDSILFDIDVDKLNDINIDEVNYLYETIRMKSLLSKQDIKPTLANYKSVLISYLTLGLDKTLKFITTGNKDVTLYIVKDLQQVVVNEKVLKFKENNSTVFQNINKKVIDNLDLYRDIDDFDTFVKKVKTNTYLDNIIYLMLENNFDSYNNIINKFFAYIKYYEFDPFSNKKDISLYCNNFVDLYINNQVKKYNKEFENIILNNFSPKENVLYAKRKEVGKHYLDKLMLKLFVRSLTDNDKSIYLDYYNDGYNISNIKEDYLKYLNSPDIEFDNINEHILIPLSNDRFDYENCLNKLKINKPNNYDEYINYLANMKNIMLLNNEISKINELYNTDDMISIMNYICYNSNLDFKIDSKIKKIINKCKKIISQIGNEVYIDKSNNKFIYSKSLDIYNIDELIEYKKYNEIIENIISKTYSFINKNMSKVKIKNVYALDYFKNVNNQNYVFEINNKNYELKRRVFSLKDLENIFRGYEVNKYSCISDSLIDFLFKNNNIIMVAEGYYDGVVDNLGLIISKWDLIIKYLNDNDILLDNLSLIDLENYLSTICFNNNIVSGINKEIVTAVFNNDCYEVTDVDKRILMINSLYENKYRMVKSTIPYLSYKSDNIEIKFIDKYSDDILKFMDNSVYKIGEIGNDLFTYSILNKNGCQIGIYENNVLVAKIYGVRNGNTLYLNGIDGKYDINYNSLLSGFANELIKLTNHDIEPINFVTLVNNCFELPHGIKIDSTLCTTINYPINTQFNDYKEFISYKYLLNNDCIYTNYSNYISTLLASNDVVDKNNFLYYDADNKYLRKRNNVIKLSNNIGEEYIGKIDSILYLCNKINNDNISDISLSSMDSIYLGDDFVLFVSNKMDIFKYVLPYDERANEEIKLILDSLKS